MRKLKNYLLEFIKEDFNPYAYALIALFLTICVGLNFYFDFEDSYIDAYFGSPIRILLYFIFYLVAWWIPALIWMYFHKKLEYLKDLRLWIFSTLSILFLSLQSGSHYHKLLIEYLAPAPLEYWLGRIVKNIANIFTVFIPAYLMFRFWDYRRDGFYGITKQNLNLRPYFIILLIMLPVVGLASFTDSFNTFYPLYRTSGGAHQYLGIPEIWTIMGYEIAYGWNFVYIEFFFRGLMVIGMARFLGNGAIVSMAVLYCFLHFGKPLPEAVSSIFGGYILGVFALKTKNIWGGVIIHIGIAWMMELGALLQQRVF